MWLAQVDQFSSFTQYGPLGALLVVIALGAKLVTDMQRSLRAAADAQRVAIEAQTKTFMEFVDKHEGKTNATYNGLGKTIAESNERMAAAITASHEKVASVLERQVRAFEEWRFNNRFSEVLEGLKRAGVQITHEEAINAARAVAAELRDARNG